MNNNFSLEDPKLASQIGVLMLIYYDTSREGSWLFPSGIALEK